MDLPTTAAPPAAQAGAHDGGRVAPLQKLTLFLCFLVVAADGFDLASVGYVVPLLKKAWSATPAQLGQVFGAGLLGLTIGSFVFGPLADRIGRKRVILVSMFVFALGSLASALVRSPGELALLRLLTGIGLGGAMPTAITLSSEFSPERNRNWLVTLMFCGFTLGLACGGGLAAVLIPAYGWQGVFVFGGVAPLVLVPVIWRWMPESLRFMEGKPRFAAEARAVRLRLTGNPDAPAQAAPQAAAAPAAREGIVATLFSRHYRSGTLLLWLAFFCTLWVYYQISSWLPTAMTGAGIPITQAATIGAMMPLGGTIGSLINAWLMDRRNPFLVLTASYLFAGASIIATGTVMDDPALLYVAVFCIGFGLSGAQTGANVLVSGFYTTAARATGVSWALAVGRVGSIVGATTGGLMLASLPSLNTTFLVFAIPTAVAAIAMATTGKLYPKH
ncbi:MFS transporter [Massilia putida]|uniref:MFS transporter n=1 Tax=Massilia putida TaxID=1141883 RepID=UPI000951E854|nr:aromatic acid/H+ symport family MFS transporter [Massilia putida]